MSRQPRQPVTCQDIQLWMSLRIDGEKISTEDAALVEAHCVECSPCAQWQREESARTQQLTAYLRLDEERALEAKIVAHARRVGWDDARGDFATDRRRLGPAWWRRNQVIMVAAASLFVMALGWRLLDQEPHHDPTIRTNIGSAGAGPNVGPHDRGAGIPELPGTTRLRDGRLFVPVNFRVVTDPDGRPWSVDYDRSRYVYEGLPEEGEGETTDQKSRIILDIERSDPRLIRMASWPYQ